MRLRRGSLVRLIDVVEDQALRAACYKGTRSAEGTYVWFWRRTHNEFDSRF